MATFRNPEGNGPNQWWKFWTPIIVMALIMCLTGYAGYVKAVERSCHNETRIERMEVVMPGIREDVAYIRGKLEGKD